MTRPESMTSQQLQESLCQLLDQQMERYERIAQWSVALPEVFQRGDDPEQLLQAMRAEMLQVQHLDQTHQLLRQRWLELGERPGAVLQQRIDLVQRRLLEVMEVVDLAEREAASARDRLRPQVSEAALRTQMLRAYQPAADHDSK